MNVDLQTRQALLAYQKNEITEHHVYRRIAAATPAPENRQILEHIADDELRHYELWKRYTGQDVAPDRFQVTKYSWLSRILGFTFAIRLMERGENGAQVNYAALTPLVTEAPGIAHDEGLHEAQLIEMLDEERLRYTGSIVLGLNDALVELTGALAGLTLALQNTRLIALTGSITGVAAALSMAASEYLSTKTEATVKSPIKAAVYTGIAYIFTVLVLILPYLIFDNYYLCLALTMIAAVLIIAGFNYYISVARNESFRRRFLEMTALSLSVAGFSFVVGLLLRSVFGVEV